MVSRLVKFVIQILEWSRVQRYRGTQVCRQCRILMLAFRQRIRLLVVLFVSVALSFWLDASLFSFLSQSFVGTLFNELQFVQETLAAIIAGLSAILGLLVAIYVFSFQMSAERFSATDRMLSFFRNERVGNIILDFLTFSIVFSLLTLLALSVQGFTPYISIVGSVGLSIVSVALIVVYFRRAIDLTQPGFVFRNIAAEIGEHLNHLTRKSRHGPLVENHLRRSVADQLGLFQEFITVFASGSSSEGSGTERKEAAAAEGMVALLIILQRYVEMKRLIPAKSYWFLRREVPIEAIGQLPETIIDDAWFEKRLIGFTERIFAQAVDAELSLLLMSIPVACRDIMLTALQVQEFGILKMVAEQVVFPYVERVSEGHYLSAAQAVYETIWTTWPALLEDDGSTVFLENLPNLPWLDGAKMQQLKIPALFRRDVLALEDMLEYEVLIEGRRISPDSELARYCQKHSVTEVTQERQALFDLFHSFLTARIKKGVESKDAIQVANALGTQMTFVRQVLLRGCEQVYQGIAKTTLENAGQALPLLLGAKQDEPEVLRMFVGEAFHYLINMIHLRRLDHFRPMLDLYVPARLAAQPKEGEEQYANEERILLGGLALLYSEFDQQDEPFASVFELYQHTFDLNAFADLLEVYLRNWQLTIPWITRYHEYVQPIQLEMHNLPKQHRRVAGGKGHVTVPDHPSPIIQRLASHYAGPPMEGAAYYLYLRVCETIGREADEEAGGFYS